MSAPEPGRESFFAWADRVTDAEEAERGAAPEPGRAAAPTPGQAAYEARQAARLGVGRMSPWETLSVKARADEEAGADAAIAWWHSERDLEPPRTLDAPAPEEVVAAIREMAIEQFGDAIREGTDRLLAEKLPQIQAAAASELAGLRAHAASLAEDLDDAGATIADYREALTVVQRERDQLRGLAAEMADDIEHLIGGNAGYIDRDMIAGYRERAGIEVPK